MSQPLKIRLRSKPLRVLCFDIENKPGTYGGGDFTHGKVTALAAQFVGAAGPAGWVLERNKVGRMTDAAREFASMWEQADVVMGHNIKQHDIGLLAGFFVTLGLPILPKRRMVDTYRDQPKMRGLSRSLENLADRWGCPEKKMHMSEYDWEQAYDGVPVFVEKMRQRCMSDVRINIWVWQEARRRGLL